MGWVETGVRDVVGDGSGGEPVIVPLIVTTLDECVITTLVVPIVGGLSDGSDVGGSDVRDGDDEDGDVGGNVGGNVAGDVGGVCETLVSELVEVEGTIVRSDVGDTDVDVRVVVGLAVGRGTVLVSIVGIGTVLYCAET